MPKIEIKTRYQVLSFHIKGYKTERNGERVEVIGPDDVVQHFGPGTISMTIENIMQDYNLAAEDIINITADYTNMRDVGSWDFWMFCRNPNRNPKAHSHDELN